MIWTNKGTFTPSISSHWLAYIKYYLIHGWVLLYNRLSSLTSSSKQKIECGCLKENRFKIMWAVLYRALVVLAPITGQSPDELLPSPARSTRKHQLWGWQLSFFQKLCVVVKGPHSLVGSFFCYNIHIGSFISEMICYKHIFNLK